MGKQSFYLLISLVVISSMVLITGCIIIAPGHSSHSGTNQEKHERTEYVSAPFPSGGTLIAKTHNGSVTVSGTDVQECALTALIRVRAATSQAAQELADQISVSLQPSGSSLIVTVDKPLIPPGHSVSIDFNIAVPAQTALELVTHNGSIEIADIRDNITLQTHNGSITASGISAITKATTHNGSINIVYSPDASEMCQATLQTHNGQIVFGPPTNFSGSLDIETHNGNVHTELPLTVVGSVSKTKLRGTIGTGQGRVHLRTHNGSVRIRANRKNS